MNLELELILAVKYKLSLLLDTFSEDKCSCCKKAFCNHERIFCDNCLQLLHETKFKQKESEIDSLRINYLLEYIDPIKNMIHDFKYRNPLIYYNLALLMMPALLNEFYQELQAEYLFAAIPMHSVRQGERVYNPPALLAKALNNFCNDIDPRSFRAILSGSRCFNSDVLIRSKDTQALYSKSLEQRKKILKDAFLVNTELANFGTIGDRHLVSQNRPMINKSGDVVSHASKPVLFLIDDITTTGATFSEAIKTLDQSGLFSRIVPIALAGRNMKYQC